MAGDRRSALQERRLARSQSDHYKWVVLSNTTLGVLIATIDASIMLIAMPDIFRGIKLDPLLPGNSFYLLWMILSFLIVSSVLVVSLGRLGDMFGRVRMYNLGFLVFTVGSLLLTVTWMQGRGAAIWLVLMRVVQGVGAAFLVANSAAIITDAFPANQRGLALGINNIAGIAGTFIGLVVGGVLAPIEWRLIFLVSVPIGILGTVWGYIALADVGVRRRSKIDWAGNLTFALGLISLMVGITYGIEPHGHSTMGWTSPAVVSELAVGVVLLAAFLVIESRVENPMFRLPLFKIRAFSFGTLSTLLAAIARGGLMFMLIIWLQGIWLPEHGYSFQNTPLWAGISMLPLTGGFLLAGPISGILSDRFGARPFATGGMAAASASFLLFLTLPVDFAYWQFALVLVFNGLAIGAFAAPNRAGVMNSLPPEHRGSGGGMNSTFQNSAQVLSIGIFFTLMIVGLSSALSSSLYAGLTRYGVPRAVAERAAHLPPVSTLFSAFLGYNPVVHLVGAKTLASLPRHDQAVLTGHEFFSKLISAPFHDGLRTAFIFSAVACAIAAFASWARGERFVYSSEGAGTGPSGAPGAPGGPEVEDTEGAAAMAELAD